MADFQDAAAGWRIYRDRAGGVSLAQLNQALKAQGRSPVAMRSYKHFEKLLRLGYTDYVSINRLDIRHANESIYDVSDRSRYADRETDNPATLAVPGRSNIETFPGSIRRISEGFATLRVSRSDAAIAVANAVKYDRGVLIFDQVGVERAVRVVEGVPVGASKLDLLLEFRSLLETQSVLGPSPFPTQPFGLVLDLGADALLTDVLTALHATFDLFESARGVVDLAASAATDQAPPITSVKVRSIEFSNPLELIVFGAVVVIGAVGYIVRTTSNAVSDGAKAKQELQQVKHTDKEEERRDNRERREQELHELQVKSMQLDQVKKTIEIGGLLQEVRPQLKEILGIEIPELDDPTTQRIEALKDQAVEAVVELNGLSANGLQLDQSTGVPLADESS